MQEVEDEHAFISVSFYLLLCFMVLDLFCTTAGHWFDCQPSGTTTVIPPVHFCLMDHGSPRSNILDVQNHVWKQLPEVRAITVHRGKRATNTTFHRIMPPHIFFWFSPRSRCFLPYHERTPVPRRSIAEAYRERKHRYHTSDSDRA